MRIMISIAMMLAWAKPSAATMQLGVNTHFDQGWPVTWLDRVGDVDAQGIRDVLSWAKIERVPGRYDFALPTSRYADAVCARKLPMLVMVDPRNPLYDGGRTVTSARGRAAFGAYVGALAARYPCIAGFEVGNEINGHGITGSALADIPANYITILRAVRQALAAQKSTAKLLGGSTNTIATGFLERLFAAGMLPLVDGVVVHPYHGVPEQLPLEFERLTAAMQRHGGAKPIWASEFGLYYASPDAAPPHALKTITVMSAAGVLRADWYALADEPWFRNMGLYRGDVPKPAGDTFRFAVQLLASGDAKRIDGGDPLTFIYRFGTGRLVMWGADRPISFDAGTAVSNARGRSIATPSTLTSDPIVVASNATYRLGPVVVLADSLWDFGSGRWRQAVVGADGSQAALNWTDWDWTSYLANPARPAFRALSTAVSTASGGNGARNAPVRLIERYVVPVPGPITVEGCFGSAPRAATEVEIMLNQRVLAAVTVDKAVQRITATTLANEGDMIDVIYHSDGANLTWLRRRARILTRPGTQPALCTPIVAALPFNSARQQHPAQP